MARRMSANARKVTRVDPLYFLCMCSEFKCMEQRDHRGFPCMCAYFSAVHRSKRDINLRLSFTAPGSLHLCLPPCESVGLGCYWVDNSELRKRKRTSLWHLLTLVTLLDFSLQLSQPALYPNAPNSSSVTVFSCVPPLSPSPRLFCTHRTALRPWRRPSQNAPQSSLSLWNL